MLQEVAEQDTKGSYMKKFLIILIFVLLGTNLLWFYGSLNQGVSVTDRSDQVGRRDDQLKILSTLFLEVSANIPKEELISLASEKGFYSKLETDGDIFIGEILFRYKDSFISDIEY